MLVLAIVLPAPAGPLALAVAGVGAALLLGPAAVAARAAALCALPLLFLLVLHGVLGDPPVLRIGGVPFSRAGVALAVAQGARLYAVLAWSLLAIARLDPSRFLDAAAARGRGVHGALALVATLQAIPRLAARAGRITEAQRARGLRVRGTPWRRLRALAPLALPLVLGAIIEADDRAATLELRGTASGQRRTALAPVPDAPWERALRWGALAAVCAALVWRWGIA